ncbi:Holliday junction resolvase RuvX [Erythrobacteraceae bacterium CFH 75059]|uniref:Holliday junction resolvase RuvX n=1 Tax=Qipengyuania thermophila TaxID=2509361 RepID=UPI0010201693|nr:Holliday junction resolvase RuvX [Qipengyuania thermophila]TCD05504.1 Holliday junction resolvase RuvX [Erythrobacteraceae bacterium CFH 75059]
MVTEEAEQFARHLPDGGALMGLDPGTRTLGVALCDAGWRFATPHLSHRRGKFGADAQVLATIAAERSVKGVVCGLPRNMDGSEGPRAQSARAFCRNLAERLGLPVLLWDERWSTVAATRSLVEQDFSRSRRAGMVDAHAAAVILQAALDRLTRTGQASI